MLTIKIVLTKNKIVVIMYINKKKVVIRMLKEELKKELVVAMKNHETVKKEQIKGLLTGIQMKEIDLKRELTNEEQIAVVKNDLKKLNEELVFATKANREDRVTASKEKIEFILDKNEVDFGEMDFTFPEVKSTADILKIFDESLNKALDLLDKADDKTLMDKWTAKMNGEVVFELPKVSSLRNMTFNHLYHHRGQLTVYLRLLDVPLPGIYGPSADEQF